MQNSASSVGPASREEYNKLIETLNKELKAAGYNGCYFDRTEHKAKRLCTEEGWFSCQVRHVPYIAMNMGGAVIASFGAAA